jgi:hypothetical protein
MTGTNIGIRCLAALMGITAVASFVDDVVGQNITGDLRRCLAIADDVARLHCFENATTNPQKPTQPPLPSTGDWRAVRTPDLHGGPDAISIMHTADMSRSDDGLAGLMLRCARGGIEALVVVVAPLPPGARPRIRFGSPEKQKIFEAEVVPPLTVLRLPREAPTLAAALEASGADELAIEVNRDDGPIRGAVALAGLTPALQELSANCPHP